MAKPPNSKEIQAYKMYQDFHGPKAKLTFAQFERCSAFGRYLNMIQKGWAKSCQKK